MKGLNTISDRVLARILKMPVHKSNTKISAHPNLPTQLLLILIPTTFSSLLCQIWHLTFQPCLRRWYVRKIFSYYPHKVRIENSSKKFLPVQKGGYQRTACPKNRLDFVWS